MHYLSPSRFVKNMYKKFKTIITICARGGSKGVPGKNIRMLLGKPLLAHTIEQAQSLGWADRIVVSTDSLEIKSVAESFGVAVPFLRPAELAQDTSPKMPAVVNAVKSAEQYWKEEYDLIVDLDPTNPLRIQEDIIGVVDALLKTKNAKTAFSVAHAYKNPYMNMIEPDKNGFAKVVKKPQKPILRRQDAPAVFEVVASIYAIYRNELEKITHFPTKNNAYYVMPEDRSLDIDSEIDFEIIKLLLQRRKL